MKIMIVDPILVNYGGHYYHFNTELKKAFEKLGCEIDFLLLRDIQIPIKGKKLIPSYPFYQLQSSFTLKRLFLHFIYIIKVSSLFRKIQKEYDCAVISNVDSWDILFSVGLSGFRKPIFLYMHSGKIFNNQKYEMIKRMFCSLCLENKFIYFLTHLSVKWCVFSKEFATFQPQFISNVAYPITRLPIIQNQEKKGIFYVASLGGPRKEKGFDSIVDLVTSDVSEQFRFIIQCNPPASGKYGTRIQEDVSKLLSLKKRNLIIINHSLSSEEYFNYLNKSSVILCIYEPQAYKNRFSGILLEAWVYGKPVIVSNGTWLSEQVQKHGGGIIVKTTKPLDLVKAIETIKSNYQEFERQAYKAGELMYKKNCSLKLVKLILKKSKKYKVEDY